MDKQRIQINKPLREPTTKELLEKEYSEIVSNPKYNFIIDEVEKFAYPNWLHKIKSLN